MDLNYRSTWRVDMRNAHADGGVSLLGQVYRNPYNYGRLNNWKVFLGVEKTRCASISSGIFMLLCSFGYFANLASLPPATGWPAFSFPPDTPHAAMAEHGMFSQLKKTWSLYDTLHSDKHATVADVKPHWSFIWVDVKDPGSEAPVSCIMGLSWPSIPQNCSACW